MNPPPLTPIASVSILIVAKYNRDSYRMLIDSAIGHAGEILTAVDDGAEDGIDGYRAEEVRYFHRALNADFASQRNFLADHATCPWILCMDTDETLQPWLWRTLAVIADSTVEEGISLPCHNNILGVEDYLAWPDQHLRMYRNIPTIRWTRPIHTFLTGVKSTRFLPNEDRYAIQHTKTAAMQHRTDVFNAAHPIT